jgi:hypothetical protein
MEGNLVDDKVGKPKVGKPGHRRLKVEREPCGKDYRREV